MAVNNYNNPNIITSPTNNRDIHQTQNHNSKQEHNPNTLFELCIRIDQLTNEVKELKELVVNKNP